MLMKKKIIGNAAKKNKSVSEASKYRRLKNQREAAKRREKRGGEAIIEKSRRGEMAENGNIEENVTSAKNQQTNGTRGIARSLARSGAGSIHIFSGA
jgi:hypothetical protein